jgi:glycosyltransferase involved in cell wall biosynthesis
MKPPKIWQLLDARNFSGIEKHVEVLAEGLTPLGFDVHITLLTPFHPHPFAERLKASGLKHHVLAGGFNAVFKAMREEKPQLIHTHGYKAGIFGRIAGRLLGIPVVSTYHAGERGKFPIWLYQAVDEGLSFLAQAVFAVSQPIQTRVKGAVLLKNAVPVAAYYMPKNPSSLVAFVGRLSHEKAPDIFCEAAKNLQGQGLEFVLYGEGPMRQALEEKYHAYVTFKGFTNMTAQEWAKIGLLAMPSRAEGMPMAALEAMAQGVPIAAADVGDLPKLVTKTTGFLFQSDNLHACIAAILAWKNTQDKEIFSKNCYDLISNEFNTAKELIILKKHYQKHLVLAR